MKLKTSAVAVIVVASIFGCIFITSLLGLWNTVNTKEPARYSSGEFSGKYNPADIRGSYTFGEISSLFEIPIKDLGNAFAVKNENGLESFQCKELEAIYSQVKEEGKEVGTDSVRIFVALYKTLPINLNESTCLPEPAVNILKNNNNLSDAQIKYLENHKITPVKIETGAKDSVPSEKRNIIKGSTTFGNLLDWGVNKEEIEIKINDTLPSKEKVIKDYASEKGIEFSILKESIQSLVNAKKE